MGKRISLKRWKAAVATNSIKNLSLPVTVEMSAGSRNPCAGLGERRSRCAERAEFIPYSLAFCDVMAYQLAMIPKRIVSMKVILLRLALHLAV